MRLETVDSDGLLSFPRRNAGASLKVAMLADQLGVSLAVSPAEMRGPH